MFDSSPRRYINTYKVQQQQQQDKYKTPHHTESEVLFFNPQFHPLIADVLFLFFWVFSFDDYYFMFSAFFIPPLYDPFSFRKYSYSLVGVVMIPPQSYCEVLVDINF